jgi:hypothetical protein
MFMQMQADGVDPSAPGALDAWIEDFNARPREQRDTLVGPAADRVAHVAGLPSTGGARAPKPKAQRRKAQGATPSAQAHKRNRG